MVGVLAHGRELQRQRPLVMGGDAGIEADTRAGASPAKKPRSAGLGKPLLLSRPRKTVDAPTRGKLAFHVAQVCRYPRHLLHGDRPFVLAVYRARKGRRLSTRFGCCHGGSR